MNSSLFFGLFLLKWFQVVFAFFTKSVHLHLQLLVCVPVLVTPTVSRLISDGCTSRETVSTSCPRTVVTVPPPPTKS